MIKVSKNKRVAYVLVAYIDNIQCITGRMYVRQDVSLCL